ncbi:GNAT family N-acetyltransferase [Kitasatospora cineracea]|uniref:RimJ/RimL family protein N-acetyltransferase n=1 Tax=Kitasatospora cineracea TaxID=88074 RepID=A0A3N4SC91_9ACTN|nr:GNAT family N-acetyltransferase [Kitasatospora cineracea]ROR45905.1 RimJ/RimL family protein N-acetyltransferase [Kitasatospora cineracea]RPE36280.1 RimJ/RimL family protein N-acetyltransferase [Kitasatospora cineracea]
MIETAPLPWPPAPIRTARLLLREPLAGDRAAIVELFTSPEVGTYIGGPRPREEFERTLPEVPPGRPGLLVVDLDGAMIGLVTLDPHGSDRLAHLHPEGGARELGYLFLPHAWGRGYATEACTAALDWLAGALPDTPVALTTQTANTASRRVAERLGFTELERFEEYGAEQWFGVRHPN